jgi:hypothetical protein
MSRVDAEPIGPFGFAMMAASAAFLALGLAWPQAAGALLRLFLATLAVGFVLARAYEAMRPTRATNDLYSPFDGYDPGHHRAAPRALHELTRRLRAADDGVAAQRASTPVAVEQTVIDAAAQRLADRYGLTLGDPSDREAIRSRVSDPLWRMVQPTADAPVGTAPDDIPRSRPLPVSRLASILDELESL